MLKNNIKITLTSLMLIGLAMAFSGNAEAQKFNATEWKTLSGYPGMIYDVEFSPKGNYFASIQQTEITPPLLFVQSPGFRKFKIKSRG